MSRAVPSRAPGWGGTASRPPPPPPKGAGEPSWASGAAEGPLSAEEEEAVGLTGGAAAIGESEEGREMRERDLEEYIQI